MKQAICALLLGVIYLNTSAQSINHLQQSFLAYLDSSKQAYSYYLQPNDIATLDVVKGYDSATKMDAKFIFSLKKQSKPKFVSLDSIAGSKKIAPGAPVLYIIDNQLIKSPALVRIDSDFILNTWVTGTAEIDNLKNAVPNLNILYITTGKRDPNAPPQIIIRGNREMVSK